jgi:hypothetical protein
MLLRDRWERELRKHHRERPEARPANRTAHAEARDLWHVHGERLRQGLTGNLGLREDLRENDTRDRERPEVWSTGGSAHAEA